MNKKRLSVLTLAVAAFATSALAQQIPPTAEQVLAASSASAPSLPAAPPVSVATIRTGKARTIFVARTPDDFHVYVEAALVKKEVPLTITTKEELADYVLTAAAVKIQVESGSGKIMRCLFAYCLGIDDSGETSVRLTRGDEVVWSYAVNKGRGQKNMQALAEAVAVHLKDDYLKKQEQKQR